MARLKQFGLQTLLSRDAELVCGDGKDRIFLLL
jgi:hypothetical protein